MNKIARLLVRIANSPRLLVMSVLLDWVVCSMSYALIEGKGPIEGLWWGIVTGSTVGYGDFYPATTGGRFVGAVLIVSMLVLTAIAISQLSAELIVDQDAFTHEEQEELARLQRENNAMMRNLLARLGGDEAVEAALAAAASVHEGDGPAERDGMTVKGL